MDFGALPPEINSARMYAGPGAGPMLAAAAGWDGLATDLYSAAASYYDVITTLGSGFWLGPAAASMEAAASRYVTWMSVTATQCEQVANQARAAVSAYESAFVMTVPPNMIALNRAQLAMLVATNILGQNTAAIAATEAQYSEMWAQDAAAMYGYASSSTAAATLAPFTPPQQATNPSGLANQAAAVAQAAGNPATNAASTSSVTGALASLTGSSPLSYLSLFSPYLAGVSTVSLGLASARAQPPGGGVMAGIARVESLPAPPSGSGTTLASPGTARGAVGSAARAAVGQAARIGGLSAPPGWTAAAPAITRAAMTVPSSSLGSVLTVPTTSPQILPGVFVPGTARGADGETGRKGRSTITITVTQHPDR